MIDSVLAVSTSQTNHSGKISFSGKVKIYSVTYHANGGGGNVPVDANRYNSGEQATILGQGDMTAPSGKTFAGWSSDPQSTAATYLPGNRVLVGGNTDLYAVWTGRASYVMATYRYVNKNGVIQTVVRRHLKDETITMPTLSDLQGLADGTGLNGWYPDSSYDPSTKTPSGFEMQMNEEEIFYELSKLIS